MTESEQDRKFRAAAEAEGGMPVSAGVREFYLRLLTNTGQSCLIDLSRVPEFKRSSLIATIREIVELSSSESSSIARPA